MSLRDILQQIEAERTYQDGRWGTAFDDANTLNDWSAYIGVYLGRAVDMGSDPAKQRANMLKVAALAVAAVESFDRNGAFARRHYEDRVPK